MSPLVAWVAPTEAGDRGQPVPGVVCRSSGVVLLLGPCENAAEIQCCQKISSLWSLSVVELRVPQGWDTAAG